MRAELGGGAPNWPCLRDIVRATVLLGGPPAAARHPRAPSAPRREAALGHGGRRRRMWWRRRGGAGASGRPRRRGGLRRDLARAPRQEEETRANFGLGLQCALRGLGGAAPRCCGCRGSRCASGALARLSCRGRGPAAPRTGCGGGGAQGRRSGEGGGGAEVGGGPSVVGCRPDFAAVAGLAPDRPDLQRQRRGLIRVVARSRLGV
mmetsp:Transcript_167004/g.536203  ORF Transcript_167004/g.536203 Transcript_167004/m.536203 type:complete len:206 (+) Transcript_167004:1867-2484(+)